MTRLADIAGHESPLRILRQSLSSGRLHHSLIFHGPEAVGKRTTALALAAALNCATGREDACGECASCRKVEKAIHPDVFYVTLERTVIPIDAIRSLRHEAAFRPYEGRRRVFLIDPADRMSPDAQNALLKTLEEPTPSSCIVLITSRPMHLLPTTRSRCQALAFGALPAEEIARRLTAERSLSGEDALRAARLSGGRLGRALEIDLAEHDAARAEMLRLLGSLAEPRAGHERVESAESFGIDTAQIAARLEMLAGLVRDMMILSAGGEQVSLLHTDVASEIRDLAGRFAVSEDAFTGMLARVRLAASDLERNVNRRLLVETLLFDLAAAGAEA